MGVVDMVLIGMSVISCVLSLFAVYLVHRAVEEKREMEADKIARENSRVELPSGTVSEIIRAAESIAENDKMQIINVPGKRIIQKTKMRIQAISKTELA